MTLQELDEQQATRNADGEDAENSEVSPPRFAISSSNPSAYHHKTLRSHEFERYSVITFRTGRVLASGVRQDQVFSQDLDSELEQLQETNKDLEKRHRDLSENDPEIVNQLSREIQICTSR